MATAVAVAAVGVSGGGDPVPAADSLAAERAPRTAEDLEKPRADGPAAGAEQDDDESGAGASAAERDGSPSGSAEAAAGQTPGDAPPHDEGTAIDRLRFLALSTRLLAGLSFVAVIFTALPVIVFGDCR